MSSAVFWNIFGTVVGALLVALFAGIYRWVKHSLDAEDERRDRLEILWADYETRSLDAAQH